jgi:hypothetical protein
MAATRNTPPEPTGTATDTSGFSEDQRNELKSLIAEAVGSATPPATDPAKDAPKKVTDAEWDTMSDRQRESWVRQLVDFRLDELSRDDEIARQRAEIEALKADKTPAPEKAPSVVTKLQKMLWGDAPATP